MISRSLESHSVESTRNIGSALARALRGRLAVLISGEYGAGKTTLVQGIAAGLGISGAVRSPSYNIVKHYRGAEAELVHVDLYRASSTAEVDELGLLELLGQRGILAVEWPGEFGELLAELPRVFIHMSLPGAGAGGHSEMQRLIMVSASDDCPPEIVEALCAAAA